MRLSLGIKDGVSQEEARDCVEKFGLMIIDSHGKGLLVERPEKSGTDVLPIEGCGALLLRSGLFKYVTAEVFFHKCAKIDISVLPDSEIDAMSPEALKQKLREIRDTALWWASQTDDDRCWLDDIKVLKSILPHGSVNFEMPDDLDFIGNCLQFKRTRCPKNPKLHEW